MEDWLTASNTSLWWRKLCVPIVVHALLNKLELTSLILEMTLLEMLIKEQSIQLMMKWQIIMLVISLISHLIIHKSSQYI